LIFFPALDSRSLVFSLDGNYRKALVEEFFWGITEKPLSRSFFASPYETIIFLSLG